VAGAAEPLIGGRLDDDAIHAAAQASWKAGRPLDNTDFTISWRKEMIRPMVVRALGDLRDAR
jgi:CO/xanthine dehydrogenase FAD-binding subunit